MCTLEFMSSSGDSSDDECIDDSAVSIFAPHVERFKSQFGLYRPVQVRPMPILQSPEEVNEEMFKSAIGMRLKSIRDCGVDADALLRGQKNLTTDDICENYSWVYQSSMGLKTCSDGDEYVKLEISPAGRVMVHDGADEADFYDFAAKACLGMDLTTVLFPLFLFNFLEHFTFMFFGVTLVPNGKVDQTRFEANTNLWVKVMGAYVRCIKRVTAQLGSEHVELGVMCHELRKEITTHIHGDHMLIISRSAWGSRFEMFAEAVMCGMSMRDYIFFNTDSGLGQVRQSFERMGISLSKSESREKEFKKEIKGLRQEVSRLSVKKEAAGSNPNLVPQEEDVGAAGAKRTRT